MPSGVCWQLFLYLRGRTGGVKGPGCLCFQPGCSLLFPHSRQHLGALEPLPGFLRGCRGRGGACKVLCWCLTAPGQPQRAQGPQLSSFIKAFCYQQGLSLAPSSTGLSLVLFSIPWQSHKGSSAPWSVHPLKVAVPVLLPHSSQQKAVSLWGGCKFPTQHRPSLLYPGCLTVL